MKDCKIGLICTYFDVTAFDVKRLNCMANILAIENSKACQVKVGNKDGTKRTVYTQRKAKLAEFVK